jgi:hypothetical protein
MTRTLYAWKASGKFYLSAFREARPDKKRPAKEYGTETELLEEVRERGAEVIWEDGN